MYVADYDKSIGIEVYATDFKGIGGRIKYDLDSFMVEEVISYTRADKGYPLYRLEKQGVDTNYVLNDVYSKHGLKLKVFGLKDANAKTIQYATSNKVISKVEGKHYSLMLIGYSKERLTRDALIGNRFTIKIIEHTDAKDALERLKKYIDNDSIPNFYGYQRFGASNQTHKVGEAIVKRRFKDAVEMLIANNASYEIKVRREYNISRDPIKALRAIPLRIRRLLVEAYQSYLFNKVLSNIIKQGYQLKPRENDLCYIFNGKTRLGLFNAKYRCILALPTIGYGFNAKNRFIDIYYKIIKEEGIKPKDFYVKEMQEVSYASNYRQACLYCKDYDYILEPLTIKFMLQKGGYATILLRELMKPRDPLNAGF